MPLVFFSGSLGSTSHRERFIDLCEARLLSCHDLPTAKRWLVEAHTHPRAKERYIMLDSGAFPAWSRGEHITLKEVMRSYRKLVDHFAPFYKAIYLVNLDIIPGSRGVTATREQIEQALQTSDENFAILQNEFGDAVLPVFHQSEDRKRLKEVSEQASFICVSPRNDMPERKRVLWAQHVHAALPSGKATHGLGTTGVEMMSTVPFFSVDSTSWVKQAGNGGIFIKTDRGFTTIKISNRSQHFDNSLEDIQRIIESQAEALELPISDLRSKSGAREFFNIATLAAVSSRGVRD